MLAGQAADDDRAVISRKQRQLSPGRRRRDRGWRCAASTRPPGLAGRDGSSQRRSAAIGGTRRGPGAGRRNGRGPTPPRCRSFEVRRKKQAGAVPSPGPEVQWGDRSTGQPSVLHGPAQRGPRAGFLRSTVPLWSASHGRMESVAAVREIGIPGIRCIKSPARREDLHRLPVTNVEARQGSGPPSAREVAVKGSGELPALQRAGRR